MTEHVLAAFAVELRKAETVAGADDGFRISLEGKAEAWSKVEFGHVDQGAVIDGAGRGLDERVRDGVEVGEVIV
jgi:hypothetical protein